MENGTNQSQALGPRRTAASHRHGPTWCRSADTRREAAVTGEIEEEAERANVSTT